MSELDRVKEQLVYLRFWLGLMVATEIALVGWLISTAIGANATLWFMGHLARSRWRSEFFWCTGKLSVALIK